MIKVRVQVKKTYTFNSLLTRASDRSQKEKLNVAGFSGQIRGKICRFHRIFAGIFRSKLCQKTIGKKQPISWEFSPQILLEIDKLDISLRQTVRAGPEDVSLRES